MRFLNATILIVAHVSIAAAQAPAQAPGAAPAAEVTVVANPTYVAIVMEKEVNRPAAEV
jgi:hypothetical protein